MVTWRQNARLRSFKIFLEEQLTRVFSLMLSAPLGFLQATLVIQFGFFISLLRYLLSLHKS